MPPLSIIDIHTEPLSVRTWRFEDGSERYALLLGRQEIARVAADRSSTDNTAALAALLKAVLDAAG